MLNTFTLASLLAQLFLAALSSEETCTEAATGAGNCLTGKCDVWIGGQKYCSQCAADGEGPIDGICKSDKAGNTCDNKVCTSCANGYFLHKGGCYQIGGTVGLLICSDTTPSDLADTAGKCTACAAGYFNNPAQTAADKPPCIACNQTDPAIDNSMGVANCATCTAPKQAGAATCKTCMEGFFGDASCTQCTDTNCAKCAQAGSAQCTECKATGNEIYLKKEGASATGTCVAENACTSTHFPTTDKTSQKKICTLCSDTSNSGIADCKTCSKSGNAVTCSACTTEGKKPNVAGTGCFDCQMDGCSHCSANGVCEECDGDKIVKTAAGATSCVTDDECTKAEGFFVKTNGSTKTCEACGDENCATCAAEGNSKCSKCKTTGTKTYLKGDAGAGTCVEASGCGSGFFSKDDAESGNKCVSCNDATDGVTDCAECTAPGEGKTNPTCTKCTDKYLKTAADGTTTCVEKTACKDDYFTVDDPTNGNKCISCGDETSGVSNCVKCTAPSSAGGKPTCSECGSGYKLEGGACVSSSTNKSGLSTGAIAGISVAAVVVVGGLVGFLCWWFICRGKA